MKTVKAFFDGNVVKLIEPVPSREKTDVLVVFPDNPKKITPQEARRLLRGSGKGEGLVNKLLRSRTEDKNLDRE